MTHTPGPWHIAEWPQNFSKDRFATVITDNRGHGIAELLTYRPSKKRDANANLIAAAPEMFEALETLLDLPYLENPVFKQIQALITRAKG